MGQRNHKARHHEKRQVPTENLLGELTALRYYVENMNKQPGIALRGQTYKELDPKAVYTRTVDGFLYGYKLEDWGPVMKRKIFIKTPGYQIAEIPEKQKDIYIEAALTIFIDQGQESPCIEVVAPDCLLITQRFSPIVLTRINN